MELYLIFLLQLVAGRNEVTPELTSMLTKAGKSTRENIKQIIQVDKNETKFLLTNDFLERRRMTFFIILFPFCIISTF